MPSSRGAKLARAEGHTEHVADLLVICTGGTNETSHVTDGKIFSEAVLLVDEPNTVNASPQHPLLNCGQNGAPDNGVSGPGVCEIHSDGNLAHTYDGTRSSKEPPRADRSRASMATRA